MLDNKKSVLLALSASIFLSISAQADVPPKPFIDDAAIEERVKDVLAGDTRLNSEDIRVSSNQGVVRLMGKVQNETEFAMAEQDAVAVPGVKAVGNLLLLRDAETN